MLTTKYNLRNNDVLVIVLLVIISCVDYYLKGHSICIGTLIYYIMYHHRKEALSQYVTYRNKETVFDVTLQKML